MRKSSSNFLAAILPAVIMAAVWSGCDLNSGDSTVRNLSINFSGLYTNSGGRVVSTNTGNGITRLDLRQNGDRLEAVDNNGQIFRGSISRLSEDGQAAFSLRGTTSAGQEGTISGTLVSSGSAANMSGTWAEPGLFGTVSGSASIVGDIGGGGGGGGTDLAISPSGSITLSAGFSRTFTASGGSGSYSWTLSDSGIGSLSANSGTSVSYTASTAGNQVITVSDGRTTQSTTVEQADISS